MLNYKLIAYQIEAEDGLHWVAEFPSLRGVVGTARSITEAVADLEINAVEHIECMRELGIEIPKEDAVQ